MTNLPTTRLCGAKTRSGGQCQKPARPNGRCRLHGGATPAGIASANFKHGRYSEALPARLLETYKAVVNDPDLLELRSAIAVTDALIVDTIRAFDTGESGKVWAGLGKAWDDLRFATGPTAKATRDRSLLRIGDLIQKGQQHGSATDDLMALLDTRRKLVRDEASRLKAMSAMISAEEAMTLAGGLAALVREHVTDPKALRGIQEGMTQLMVRHASSAGS